MRYALRSGASPFDCDKCTEKDQDARNCRNKNGLSEAARAVTEYTGLIKDELREKTVQKAATLGNLRLYECPVSYITFDTSALMRLVFLVEDSGVLLHGGGWAEQPYWLVEAVEIYRMEKASFIERMRAGKE